MTAGEWTTSAGMMIVVGGYAFSLFFFHILGGIGSAADAIQSWGRSSAERALEQSGSSPGSFARARARRR